LKENNPENFVVDLRGEKGERVAVNSIAMCPLDSYNFVLGCADPLIRLYDIRVSGTGLCEEESIIGFFSLACLHRSYSIIFVDQQKTNTRRRK